MLGFGKKKELSPPRAQADVHDMLFGDLAEEAWPATPAKRGTPAVKAATGRMNARLAFNLHPRGKA